MPTAADFTFSTTGIDEDEIRVMRFTATEGISQCFTYDLELASFEVTADFEDIVGEPGTLQIHTAHGQRFVHGIISRWEEVGHDRAITYYAARLVPRLWTLTLKRQSRIFQKMTTPQILQQVLEKADIASDMFRFSLSGKYEQRLYCVQYRETDYDFLSRLMEEEGIFFFFEHTEDGHVMVIGDSSDVHAELPEDPTLRFRESDAGMLSEETVTAFRYARTLCTGAVTLKEFDFKKPALALSATKAADADKEKKFESYEYPGDFHIQGLGDRLAGVRLEEERSEAYLGVGETDCRRLEAGYRFAMEDHPRDEVNTDLVILRARHVGEQPHAGGGGAGDTKTKVWHSHFECTPWAVPYRPARLTPRPRIDGPQTAVVVGPSGEEIHCDEHGRVKVKFHWDRSDADDDTASCWIRVSQGWGGAGWGMMFIPRVGQEVIVEFLEGDPDRPLITGRVYNGLNPPPYALPGEKTKSTIMSQTTPGGGGSNEIRFEDSSGNEEFFIHAQKDMNEVVKNNKTVQVHSHLLEEVGGNRTRTVGGNETITVAKDRTEEVKANETLTVGGSETILIGGNETIVIKGARSESVGGAAIEAIGGSEITAVKGDQTLTVGGALVEAVGKARATVVKGDLEQKSGAVTMQMVGGAKVVKVKGNYSEQAALISETAAGVYKIKADGDMNVAAANVNVSAQSSIKLKCGGSSIEIKSGEIKITSGGSVTIKASGTLTLKGSSLKAN